jgi:antitoxin ParD1/3/4
MTNGNTNMSISLPEQMKKSVQEVAKKDYYGTPSDYVRSVIRDDLKRRDQRKLEQMLLEGLHSGKGSEMTKEEWSKLKHEAHTRLQ